MASQDTTLPRLFESLQQKIDQDAQTREKLHEIIQTLEKQDKTTQAILSKSHSTKTSEWPSVVQSAQPHLAEQVSTVTRLAQQASQYPFYKFNQTWNRQMQDTIYSTLYFGYLGGYTEIVSQQGSVDGENQGRLLTIEQVGAFLKVPVNLKDKDEFHITIEEYLHALISLVDELARLARNTVTLGDYSRPVEISQFIKNLHAGFSVLNLKNDSLRKRSDGIKYRVKEVEDVVYDLSLRGLVPKSG